MPRQTQLGYVPSATILADSGEFFQGKAEALDTTPDLGGDLDSYAIPVAEEVDGPQAAAAQEAAADMDNKWALSSFGFLRGLLSPTFNMPAPSFRPGFGRRDRKAERSIGNDSKQNQNISNVTPAQIQSLMKLNPKSPLFLQNYALFLMRNPHVRALLKRKDDFRNLAKLTRQPAFPHLARRNPALKETTTKIISIRGQQADALDRASGIQEPKAEGPRAEAKAEMEGYAGYERRRGINAYADLKTHASLSYALQDELSQGPKPEKASKKDIEEAVSLYRNDPTRPEHETPAANFPAPAVNA